MIATTDKQTYLLTFKGSVLASCNIDEFERGFKEVPALKSIVNVVAGNQLSGAID